jgi:hypothetical protein
MDYDSANTLLVTLPHKMPVEIARKSRKAAVKVETGLYPFFVTSETKESH